MDVERRLILPRSESSHLRPAPFETGLSPTMPKSSLLSHAAVLVDAIARQDKVEGIVDAALHGLSEWFGYENILLLHNPAHEILTIIGAHGYTGAGTRSEVPSAEGVIGAVLSNRRLINVSHGSQVRRFAKTARKAPRHDSLPTGLPGLPNAMSQIGVPMITLGNIHGVLFVESMECHAFTSEDEAALTIVARQLAASLILAGGQVSQALSPVAPKPVEPSDRRPFRVSYHPSDDSVFIDNDYLIKGVAGRLLMFMLDVRQREGRDEFTNREIRLSAAVRLPDVKDNLDTRLILLRRRLEEKNMPIRLVRIGRGRIQLQLLGKPIVERAS